MFRGMGLYLPFYSPAAVAGEEARRELRSRPGATDPSIGGVTPGGMWKNISSPRQQQKEDNQKTMSDSQ